MKSNLVNIDNQGNGFDKAIEESKKVAVYMELNQKDSLQLQLLTEEMLSLVRIVTGEMQATFWIETELREFNLHMSTKTKLDKEERQTLLAAATTGRNEHAGSFLGYLRDAFEGAMAANADHGDTLPDDVMDDLANHTISCTDSEWDGYEQSTLRRLANCIKIGIKGETVDMTVTKVFA